MKSFRINIDDYITKKESLGNVCILAGELQHKALR